MSEDEKAFQTLLGPTLEVRNKQNEVVFSMKRKGEQYGQVYYIFEMHMDRVEPERFVKFQVAWTLIKRLAREMRLPLFNIDEIQQAMMAELSKMASTTQKPPEIGKQFDITISILNHATGETLKLTMGIIATPK